MARRFDGGVHPEEMKHASAASPIEDFPLPALATIPLVQHLGAPAQAIVKKGDSVRKGQLIGEPGGFVSACIHASVAGAVKDVGSAIHPLGHNVPAVVIERAGDDEWADGLDVERDWRALARDELRELIRLGGLVGMGGATFPTHVKLSPPLEKPIDTAIVNGVECEPYLTADHRLMLEDPALIVEGLEIIMTVLDASTGIVAIEANKPDAVQRMRETMRGRDRMRLEVLPVRYPQGAEKQLIQALLGREVPSGGLPMDVGVVVQNVGTAHAIACAVRYRRPLIERVVTVTGDAVERPRNFRVRVGTPVSALLDACGRRPGIRRVILGGPMMGLAQRTDDVPVTRGTSGVLALMDGKACESRQCIRCGRCVVACPARIIPATLSALVESGHAELADEHNVMDCIECGCCAYVCPSRRKIIHQIKYAKALLTKKRKDAAAKK
ncbi:MAG: electron transport complex subunit RsxC [Planctomycetota bacterium]